MKWLATKNEIDILKEKYSDLSIRLWKLENKPLFEVGDTVGFSGDSGDGLRYDWTKKETTDKYTVVKVEFYLWGFNNDIPAWRYYIWNGEKLKVGYNNVLTKVKK